MVRIHPPRLPNPRLVVAHAAELALDVPREPRTTNVPLDVEDKPVLDVLQQLMSLREGRRLTQWETLNRVLALALEHPEVQSRLPPRRGAR